MKKNMIKPTLGKRKKNQTINVIREPHFDSTDRIIREDNLPRLADLLKTFSTANKKGKVKPVKPFIPNLTEKDSQKLINKIYKEIDKTLVLGKRKKLTNEDKQSLNGIVNSAIKEAIYFPSLDAKLILSNQDRLAPLLYEQNSRLFSSENGIVLNVSGNAPWVEGENAAWYVDVLVELLSLLISLAGVSITVPKGAKKAIGEVIEKFLRDPKQREILEQLFKYLAEQNWHKVLELLDKAEIGGLIGEMFLHLFAELSIWDYVITLAKFLAWLGALFLSGGAAFAARLVAVGLDICGLGVKIHHGIEKGWM